MHFEQDIELRFSRNLTAAVDNKADIEHIALFWRKLPFVQITNAVR